MSHERPSSAGATTALGNNLCEFPSMFSKCLWIGLADEFHTATATLVNLGEGPLAITCAHVIADYLELWEVGRALIRVSNIRVSPSQLAGCDRDLDLAVIRLTNEQAEALLNEDGLPTQFYQPPRWPPDPAKEGESVAIGGFPAQWRQKRSEAREIIFGYYGIGATRVTSASERHFGCQFEREQWMWMSRKEEFADLTAMGGLSGGPVFADRHLHRALVGIVSDFGPDGDIVLMAHAHWINQDGSIRTDQPWLALR